MSATEEGHQHSEIIMGCTVGRRALKWIKIRGEERRSEIKVR